MTDRPSTKMKRRLNLMLTVPILIVMGYTMYSIFKVSVVESDYWKSLANGQQLQSTVVSASRGTIFDSNGSVLAQSATVYTVFVDPVMLSEQLAAKDKTIAELQELIRTEKDAADLKSYQEKLDKSKTGEEILDELVTYLSKTFSMDTSKVRNALTDTSTRYKEIKKEVEKTTADQIENKLTELAVDGVRCDPTTSRVYPQNSLAANVIGHTDYDGNGIYGLEAYYDDYLSGVDGRIITAKDGSGNEIPYRYKQSYDAQDGDNLNLNIDMNIQFRLEKALESAVKTAKPNDRACGIIMNPKTGQIYAMATSYSYDPNNPSEITDEATAQELSGMDKDSDEYQQSLLDAWSTQWKNKAISEIYFPGSVFKVITGSSALEEGAITLDDTFSCNTAITVEDTTFHCWSFSDHGMQNLQQAMINSCNPAFVQIGMAMGAEKFCHYFDAYGFNELTGIDLPGESSSITMPLERMGLVQLASSSFGQTNKVTPIQMISAFSAAINGGNLVQPEVVNTITDENGNVVKKNNTVVKRQVISEETSATMREILEGVVNGQKSSNSYIQGYRIGGKSGTSQKIDVDATGNTYVASYCAFAPADDPEIIMLVMVDDPTGGQYYGSQVAAPICVDVLTDVLPYLEIFPEYTADELQTIQVSVPSVQYYSVEDAKKTLEGLGLEVKINGSGDTVTKQYPSGVSIESGGSVVLYTDSTEPETVSVPSLQGLTREQAKTTLESYGLNLTAEGSGASEEGTVAQADQSVAAGQSVPTGTAVSVTFSSGTVQSQ